MFYIGALAGDALTDADFNIAVGQGALSADTQGNKSTVGYASLFYQNFTSATDSAILLWGIFQV